ncbi:MAG TPA: UDP-N-acetylglucosamine 2-epimerase [Clostridia bacterium]|nr:UDP-N-acetylglucosamine 2-epimerase [Clostridia bacterium]
MRKIAVVTVGRSDYGIYRPVLRRMAAMTGLDLRILVSGAHLLPEYGDTWRDIERDGFTIGRKIPMLESGKDDPKSVAKAMSAGLAGFAEAYESERPDLVLLLGDRYEMFSAAAAALPFKLPLAHIHGGEVTEGAIDEAMRHSISKMSHLHFVAAEVFCERLMRMGEEPWRITVSGAPGLDNLHELRLLSSEELKSRFGVNADAPFLLITFHPVTLEHEHAGTQFAELLAALEEQTCNLVFTYPNADTDNRAIIAAIQQFIATHRNGKAVQNLGTAGYFSMMSRALAMVGNSSSGILEATSFKLPVVNVGNRQRERLQARNVVNCGTVRGEIAQAIRMATSEEFRRGLAGLVNPYGTGNATEKIVGVLSEVPLDQRLILKRFIDTGAECSHG